MCTSGTHGTLGSIFCIILEMSMKTKVYKIYYIVMSIISGLLSLTWGVYDYFIYTSSIRYHNFRINFYTSIDFLKICMLIFFSIIAISNFICLLLKKKISIILTTIYFLTGLIGLTFQNIFYNYLSWSTIIEYIFYLILFIPVVKLVTQHAKN